MKTAKKATATEEEKTSRRVGAIPYDRKKFLEHSEIFGQPFLHLIPTDKDGFITYSVKNSGHTLNYRFSKEKADALKSLLKVGKNESPFTLGLRGDRLWMSMIYFAAKHYTGTTSGQFTMKELLEVWGCEKSGQLYDDIKRTYLSLVSFVPAYHNNKEGDEAEVWGEPFVLKFSVKGRGENMVFSYTINPDAMGITAKWIAQKSGLEKEKLKEGYISIPISELKESADPRYKNFIKRVRLLMPGTVITVKFNTILAEWIMLGKDNLRRRELCHGLVLSFFRKAKEDGEIKSYKPIIVGLKNWKENWKVQILKSKNKTLDDYDK